MALIMCPECGKEISDKANACIHCGYPISEYINEITSKQEDYYFDCQYCKSRVKVGDDYCDKCGMRVTPYFHEVVNTEEYYELDEEECTTSISDSDYDIGVYRTHLFGNQELVICPVCGSKNCSIHYENFTIPEKTKTRYTANLNPLHPFTLLNKKEKVVRKEQSYDVKKFMCNKCGKIFR